MKIGLTEARIQVRYEKCSILFTGEKIHCLPLYSNLLQHL